MVINWGEAPLAATHGVVINGLFKGYQCVSLEEQAVFDWEDGIWVDHKLTVPVEKYLEINKEYLEERPAPLVEAELPEGKVWPEGADFYYPQLGVFFRYDKPGFKYYLDVVWTALTPMHIEEYAKKDVIHRFPAAQPKAAPKKEEPPKKRAVGWWN